MVSSVFVVITEFIHHICEHNHFSPPLTNQQKEPRLTTLPRNSYFWDRLLSDWVICPQQPTMLSFLGHGYCFFRDQFLSDWGSCMQQLPVQSLHHLRFHYCKDELQSDWEIYLKQPVISVLHLWFCFNWVQLFLDLGSYL